MCWGRASSVQTIFRRRRQKIILSVSTSKLWYILIWSTFVFNLIATFLIDNLKNKHSILLIKRDASVCRSLKALWGYMKRMNINHVHVWETIKDLVVKAIIA